MKSTNLITRVFLLFTLTGILSLFISGSLSAQHKTQAYQPEWESLIQHPTPKWFRDGKFGIYFHWGVYSVPAYSNEWYPRNMYRKESDVFKHHRETYGPQSKFGYKDFIPMFTAEHFDAQEWVKLFKKAGAKYIGPVAEHHDGFAMWDSKLTDWDAADMGPQRDITGELAKAARKEGLKFLTSFHHAFNWKYYEPAFQYDAKDPKYAGLYGTPHAPGTPESKEFLEDWLGKIIEVIDNYRPDYIWFDFGWQEETFEPYKRQFLSYYYNKGEEWGKDVVVTYKRDHLPEASAVLDLERGRLDSLRRKPWNTDTSIDRESWCYIDNPDYKSVNTLIDNLVDRVSKNGNTLLNIAPRPDGTIPEPQKERLLAMGEWFDVNGEAIYGTRYWKKYGEGPTQIEGGNFIDGKKVVYTANDVRFTVKDNVLYAIALAWPEDELTIKSLKELDPDKIESITMLGDGDELDWQMTEEGLVVEPPRNKPCEHAYSFKIQYSERFWIPHM